MAKPEKAAILKQTGVCIMNDLDQVTEEIKTLTEALRAHQHRYYVEAMPSISDQMYDHMMDRLIELEQKYPDLAYIDSPSQRVGSDLGSSFPEVSHSVPVLSLDKAYTEDALLQWVQRTSRKNRSNLSYVVEEKMDGVSLVLYYQQGLLARAVTRGNGFVGNDVTANAKTIRSIPLRLTKPVDIAVRGEVFLHITDFEQLNHTLEVPYANPRNLTAGTLRRLKSSETAQVPLCMYAYEAYGEAVEGRITSHVEALAYLHDLGFLVNPAFALFSETVRSDSRTSLAPEHEGTYHEIIPWIVAYDQKRAKLPYEIDGLVVKVNELEERQNLGYTGHHPRWAIAFKFDAPQAQSVVKVIDVQVGRTGRITPVARVGTVKVGNSMVSNVTLHNQDYIEMLELAIGDTVSISKRGDVIPAVDRVVEKNEEGNRTWFMPTQCPSCATKLVTRGAHRFCPNPECPDQMLAGISFFVGKGQMDIEGFGPETVSFLVGKNLVHDIPDIYRVDYASLIGEPGFKEKKVQSLSRAVQKSLERPFRTVLVSLGIADFGPKAVDLLVDSGVTSMRQLLELVQQGKTEPLLQIKGFGQKTVDALFASLRDERMQKRIAQLEELGLTMEEKLQEPVDRVSQVFANQLWCVTGSFAHFSPRSLALKEIERRGGRTSGSVTGKTTHLLVGEGAGSKLRQAQNLGVRIVSEQQFLALLEDA